MNGKQCGDYVIYFEGNIPCVISVPHGGTLRPDDIPDRTSGCMDEDWWTIDLAYDVLQQWPTSLVMADNWIHDQVSQEINA
jgi:N-formylglutamate amidohydrolase